jgi:2-amino-4-hydroxy-6-hydroxymethyldihydropteridine diphosphokinase
LIVLGLGSNIGDKLGNLQRAVSELRKIVRNIKISPVYKSDALLPESAPPEWDIHFFNIALSCESNLLPRDLLAAAKAIENNLGRMRRGHWGPREIDIDILAYGGEVVEQEDLAIPHKGLLDRDFALVPFADVAPDWEYPVAGKFYGKTARELAKNLTSELEKTRFLITI